MQTSGPINNFSRNRLEKLIFHIYHYISTVAVHSACAVYCYVSIVMGRLPEGSAKMFA